ncbi:hypothetical protein SDC9_208525 [bioreactor metagenome]|uniref:Uncharacterized protein n=1 Tax=bioreactor metagenome TaxID=1076179 RepID=A0A645JME4_9ZZZZ
MKPETMDAVRWCVTVFSVIVLATFAGDIRKARKMGVELDEPLKAALFLGLFLVVFYAGNFWVTGAAMLCAFVYGMYDAGSLCLETLRGKRVPDCCPNVSGNS